MDQNRAVLSSLLLLHLGSTPQCLAHTRFGPQQSLWSPAKSLVLGCGRPTLLLELQGKAGPTDGSGACLGLTPRCLLRWPCFVEEFIAGWPREQGLPWLNAPSFALKMDSEALICITPLTVWFQDTCHFSSTLPACAGVKNSLFVCLHK